MLCSKDCLDLGEYKNVSRGWQTTIGLDEKTQPSTTHCTSIWVGYLSRMSYTNLFNLEDGCFLPRNSGCGVVVYKRRGPGRQSLVWLAPPIATCLGQFW